MKVALFTGVRQIEWRDEPKPRPASPGEVVVRIDRLGVCGSDVHYWADGGIGPERLEFPQTLGHECAGTVAEVGEGVARLQEGDRVAIDPAFSCGQCDQCQVGRQNTCRQLRFMGTPGQALGGAAEYGVIPADNCLRIPDRMSLEMGVMVEPLSVAIYAVRLAEVFPAARVAILGSGPIGLCVLLAVKAQAPCEVFMTDLIDERLAMAATLGADWTGNAAEGQQTVDTIVAREPDGLDVVFECSGDPACIDQAAQLLVPGGRVIQVGIPATERIDLEPHRFRRKELAWLNVRRQRGCMVPAIRMIDEGLIDPSPLVTHRFNAEQLADAFELVADYRDGVVKAMVEIGPG